MLHVTDYLWNPAKYPVPAICVVYGNEPFLKYEAVRHLREAVLDTDDAEFSFTRFDGAALLFPKLAEELSTVAMFGGGRRLVLVEDADPFVSKNRPELEDYVDKPAKSGVLLLQVNTFPSNTKLYKKLSKTGLLIDCGGVAEKQIPAWIVRWSKLRHRTQIEPAAAGLLVELVGTEMGLIDQELAKLALMVPEPTSRQEQETEEKASHGEKTGKKTSRTVPKTASPTESALPLITADLVGRSVGSWRHRTAYVMLDAALAGQTSKMLQELARLLAAGEQPTGILAQIAKPLRQMAAATRLIFDAEAAGKKMTVRTALAQAGANRYFLDTTEKQLCALGRRRASHLLEGLLKVELDLKGDSRAPHRLILEQFLIRLSNPACKGMS